VSLEQISKEELQEMALVEIAYEILKEKKEPLPFHELVDRIAELLELSPEQVRNRISQFYTDLNIDGRFINVGANTWGIKSWYPVEQFDDEIVPVVKSKRKRAKALEDDDFDDLDYDDLDEFDDLDDFDEVYDEDSDDDEYDEDEYEDEDLDDESLLDDEDDEFIDDELLDDDIILDDELGEELDDEELDEEDEDR